MRPTWHPTGGGSGYDDHQTVVRGLADERDGHRDAPDEGHREDVRSAAAAHEHALPSTPEPVQPPADSSTPESLLRQLASLHAARVLTDEEFAAKKADVLSRM